MLHTNMKIRCQNPGKLREVAAQDVSYGAPDISKQEALDMGFTDDSWNGDETSLPNPSDGKDSQKKLQKCCALIPTSGDVTNKRYYKLPFRETADGPIYRRGVEAGISAINGARGGVDAPEKALKEAYNLLLDLAVWGDIYPERSDAPTFKASNPNIEFRGNAGVHDAADGMDGVVWRAGSHTMYVDGEPTPVYVPQQSIQNTTYPGLKQRVEAGNYPKLGLDHGDNLHSDVVPVATEIGVLKVGEAKDFAVSQDGCSIVMTEYSLNSTGVDAAQTLKDKEYSIVGDLRIHSEDGEPKTVERDGKTRLVVSAANIRQIDVVASGAVDGAKPGNVPQLKQAATSTAEKPEESATFYRSCLMTAAKSMKGLDNLRDKDDPQEILEGAAKVVEKKDEYIHKLQTAVAEAADVHVDRFRTGDKDCVEVLENLEAMATAAEQLGDFHNVDVEAEGVQSLVDVYTEKIRRDIAAKEQSLPGYNVDRDERVKELAGETPRELERMRGNRANEILGNKEARKQYGKATAKHDFEGDGAGVKDSEAEKVAGKAMTVSDRVDYGKSDRNPVEFMEERYGENPADFVDRENPVESYIEATTEGN